jgi:hypothetical protein
MPDISMCQAEDIKIEDNKIIRLGTNVCPLREICYRFKAKPSMYQSFSDYRNDLNKKKTECGHFMEIWKK